MRQELIDSITTALAGITTANGFITDIGNNVSEWSFFNELNPAPVLQVRDIACTPVQGTQYANVQSTWSKKLEIKIIYVACETTTTPGTAPPILRNILKDVIKAVGSIDYPDNVSNVYWGGDDMGGSQDSKKYIGISITMFIEYTTDAFTD